MSPITLGAKRAGERSARNPHATFDVAGAGDGLTVTLMRHSHGKPGGTDRRHLRSTAPAPDPTDVAGAGDGLTVTLMRHSHGKPGGTDRRHLRSTAPAPDPTDEAGVGNGLTAELVRHSQRKRGVTDRIHLRSTAPAPDPTTWPTSTRTKKCPTTMKICWAKNQIALRTSKIMRPNDEVGMKGQITLP